MNEAAQTTLLVVDDESAVCRALRRMLRGRVQRILTAETPQDAETVLRSANVTHLVCDHYLGPGQPLGAALAVEWRQRFPTLTQVVILTGKDTSGIESGGGIDHVLPKTTEPDALAALLRL